MGVTISGSAFVPAKQTDVWNALHDVNVVAACIPGCRELECESDHAYRLSIVVQLGFLTFGFSGTIEVAASDPPNSYSLVGHGEGVATSRAWGSTQIRLSERHGGCALDYRIEANLGGPLSTLAQPFLVSKIGRTMSDRFVERFGEKLCCGLKRSHQ